MATHFVYFVKLAAHKAKNPSEYVHTNEYIKGSAFVYFSWIMTHLHGAPWSIFRIWRPQCFIYLWVGDLFYKSERLLKFAKWDKKWTDKSYLPLRFNQEHTPRLSSACRYINHCAEKRSHNPYTYIVYSIKYFNVVPFREMYERNFWWPVIARSQLKQKQ